MFYSIEFKFWPFISLLLVIHVMRSDYIPSDKFHEKEKRTRKKRRKLWVVLLFMANLRKISFDIAIIWERANELWFIDSGRCTNSLRGRLSYPKNLFSWRDLRGKKQLTEQSRQRIWAQWRRIDQSRAFSEIEILLQASFSPPSPQEKKREVKSLDDCGKVRKRSTLLGERNWTDE